MQVAVLIALALAGRRVAPAPRARLVASTIDAPVIAAPDTPPPPAAAATPGQLEDALFEQSESVRYWREWNDLWDAPSASGLAQSNALLEKLSQTVGASLQRNPIRAGGYWAYHLGRASFFASQWLAAFLAFSATNPSDDQSAALQPGQTFAAVPRLFAEALSAFSNDYDAIEAGHYPLPYDQTSPTHRQFNPLFAAQQSALFVNEAVANLQRRGREPTPLWVKSGSEQSLPAYYNTFHYQSDGYMSTGSAAVYEASTEALFLGRQDSMQRLTLSPLAAFVTERAGAKLDVLEIGCGTGRFLSFLLDGFGQHFKSTSALELSPYYLEKARSNVRYAASLRGWEASRSDVRFLLANAEDVPLEDGSQDAIISVYMFHELPEAAQRKIAREVGRLLRPGGLFVLTDSLQLGDRPALDAQIPAFSNLNEPFYENFINTNFAELFAQEAGLVPEWKGLRSATKTLSFRKPA